MGRHHRRSNVERQRTTRRDFLQKMALASGAIALPQIVPASALGADGAVSPSNRITVGLSGKGLMGSGHLRRLVGDKDVRVLAVCDPDRVRRQDGQKLVEQTYAADMASGQYKGCAAYNDYREMLARADIDAVLIATPDHWHSLQAIHAAKAGKDVYCEKPISVTIREGRELVQTVQRYGRIFQTGTQYRSIPTVRSVVEFVRGGGIGKVKSVFTLWSDLGAVRAGQFQPYAAAIDADRTARSQIPLSFSLPGEPVPDGLDWDMWVGPAQWNPYNPVFHTNPTPGVVPWCFCEDFGVASVTWHHSHSADVIQYALGMERSGPVEIVPPGGEYPTLTCRYANGTLLHLVNGWDKVKSLYNAVPANARLAGNFGGLFVGERGWVTSMSTGGQIEGGPEGIFEEMKLRTREVNIGENNHHANWFDCIKTRREPNCSEEIGHRGASLGHLTIIAFKLGRPVKWDPAREEFPDDEQANRLLSRSMRSPWRI